MIRSTVGFSNPGTGGTGNGAQGTTGAQGTQGSAGEVIYEGIQGTQGTQGSLGSQGSVGSGTQGSQGSIGTQGASGTQGTVGAQGSQGTLGAQGNGGTAGADGDKYSTTATGSLTIGNSGTASITVTDTNVDYTTGQDIVVAYDINNIQYGRVISYSPITGILTFNKTSKIGSGTYTTWEANLAGAVGIAGAQGTEGAQGTVGAQGTLGTQGSQGTLGTQGVQGSTGSTGAGGTISYYGSFYDTYIQEFTDLEVIAGSNKAVLLRSTDISNGISIIDNSKVTFAHAGVYDLQFSFQFYNTGGGGNGQTVEIWLRKNGVDVPETNTRVAVIPNSPYVVSAWDFMFQVSDNDYFEVVWSTDNHNIVLKSNTGTLGGPNIPSAILTVIPVTYAIQGTQGSQGASADTADFSFTSGTITNSNDITIESTGGDIILNADGSVYLGSANSGNGIVTDGYLGLIIGDETIINTGTGNSITDVIGNISLTPGPQGTSGTQGTAGAQGATGTAGANGTQGTAGAQGATGTAGANGTQGTAGAQGATGTQGTLGTQGATGAGTQGTQGTLGTQGTSGATASAPLTLTQAANNANYPLTISSANEQGGGTGYSDLIKFINSKSGATNINKHLRINSTGGLEIVNSAYTATSMIISDAGALTTASTITPGAYSAGQTIKTTVWSAADMGFTTTVNIGISSYVNIASKTYTPASSSSYIFVEVYARYYVGGASEDSFFSQLTWNGAEFAAQRQFWANASGGGTRSSTLFPLAGRITNSSATGYTLAINARRDSSDDTLQVYADGAFNVKITEIAR